MDKKKSIPKKWKDLFKLIPGYDPIKTKEPGEWFDVETAEKAISFFPSILVYWEGEKASLNPNNPTPFKIEPWQEAIIGCIFGWKKEDGARRYRECFLYIPRKNGKTPLVAGIAIMMAYCDNEPGAQMYCAAAGRRQATHLFTHAQNMLEGTKNESIRNTFDVFKTSRKIEFKTLSKSYLEVLPAEAKTQHGQNAHLVIIDELHAQPDRELTDTLITGTASRRQPLIMYVTTADYFKQSICNEKYELFKKVRDGNIKNSSLLPIIYEADLKDDWKDKEVWKRVNPNFGISVKEEYFKSQISKIESEPSFENTFKRLHLNIRTESNERWLNMMAWKECQLSEISLEYISSSEFDNRLFYGGLDLASTQDITAFNIYTPPIEQFKDNNTTILPGICLTYFWVPIERARDRDNKGGIPYLTWANNLDNFILTEGDEADFKQIRKDIVRICGSIKNFICVGFDKWNTLEISQELNNNDGITMFQVPQTFSAMNEPSKKLEAMLAAKSINVGMCPVMEWMAGNVSIKRDPNGNFMPCRKKSIEKIDGISALLMSINQSICHKEEIQDSIYSKRDLIIL